MLPGARRPAATVSAPSQSCCCRNICCRLMVFVPENTLCTVNTLPMSWAERSWPEDQLAPIVEGEAWQRQELVEIPRDQQIEGARIRESTTQASARVPHELCGIARNRSDPELRELGAQPHPVPAQRVRDEVERLADAPHVEPVRSGRRRAPEDPVGESLVIRRRDRRFRGRGRCRLTVGRGRAGLRYRLDPTLAPRPAGLRHPW